jgi:MFS family permease
MGHGETKVSVVSQNRVPIIICFVVACSAFPFSLLHYFLPQMLRKQFQISVENLGLYTGLVDFADSFSSFISSAFLGYLSDVYGKKYLLIASLFSSFLRLFLYPFVKNIWLLIALECTYGLVNCTSVMVRAILVEFSTENNRVLYFGYLTASYALSRAFSSLVGGLVVNFQYRMDVDNPYMIYSLLAALLTLLSVILSFFIPSTSKYSSMRKQEYYPNSTQMESLERFLYNWLLEIHSVTNLQTLLLVLCRGMISFASCTLLWTLFLFTPLRDYGLQLDALHVGIIFMVYGLISFCFQFAIFDKVVSIFSLKGTFMLGSFLSIIQLLMLPTITPMPYWNNNYEKSSGTTFLVVIFISIEVVLYAVGEILRPALDAMIVNTTDLDKQGIVQGVSRMSHVFSDAVGSVVVGWLFSFFVETGHPVYVFIFSATFYLIPAFIVYLMPSTIESHKSIQKKKKSKEEEGGGTEPSDQNQPKSLKDIAV